MNAKLLYIGTGFIIGGLVGGVAGWFFGRKSLYEDLGDCSDAVEDDSGLEIPEKYRRTTSDESEEDRQKNKENVKESDTVPDEEEDQNEGKDEEESAERLKEVRAKLLRNKAETDRQYREYTDYVSVYKNLAKFDESEEDRQERLANEWGDWHEKHKNDPPMLLEEVVGDLPPIFDKTTLFYYEAEDSFEDEEGNEIPDPIGLLGADCVDYIYQNPDNLMIVEVVNFQFNKIYDVQIENYRG